MASVTPRNKWSHTTRRRCQSYNRRQAKRTRHKWQDKDEQKPKRKYAERTNTYAPTSRRSRQPTDLGQRVGHVAAYHHSLGHVTVDVQVKKVSPWGIPAKGPFLGSVPQSHGSTVATLSGLQLATLSSVPVSTLMPSGSGATVGHARVDPSALQFGMEPTPVFGEVWRDLKSDN